VGTWSGPKSTLITGFTVEGRFAYLLDPDPALLRIIDVSDKRSPKQIAAIDLAYIPRNTYGHLDLIDIAVTGDYALVAASVAGLRVLDIRPFGAPRRQPGKRSPSR
jgi:hypothetical protein